MRELFKKMNESITSGQDAVLVTIVASSGSTPRGSGARMLVTKDGRAAGTVGGGAVEFECEKMALKCLENKGSTREYFRLQHNDVADIGMICGGNVDVYFRYIAAGDEYFIGLTRKIDELYERGERCWLITQIQEDNDGIISVYSKKRGIIGADVPEDVIKQAANGPVRARIEAMPGSSAPASSGSVVSEGSIPASSGSVASEGSIPASSGGAAYYIEPLVEAGRVFVFGGGHVSQQLVPLLARCGFRCVVIEDRAEFAGPELFEGCAAEIRLINMDTVAELVPEITEDDFICIMTRGHKDDYLVQYQMLKTPACYIGVIGSRHKIAGVNARLKSDGYTDEDLQRITTPIGLDILAETPAEIAVSVTAQLIEVRATRNGSRKLERRNK